MRSTRWIDSGNVQAGPGGAATEAQYSETGETEAGGLPELCLD